MGLIDYLKGRLGAILLLAWIGSLVAVGFWQHSAGAHGERLVWKEHQLKAERAARAQEQEFNQRIQEGRDEANRREIKLRADVVAARSVESGLRNTIADIRRRLPADSPTAVRVAADTGLQLLESCTVEYRALAEVADRHAGDVKLLMGSWPGGDDGKQRDSDGRIAAPAACAVPGGCP